MVGPKVDAIVRAYEKKVPRHHVNRRRQRDGMSSHITLIHGKQLKALEAQMKIPRTKILDMVQKLVPDPGMWHCHGMGKAEIEDPDFHNPPRCSSSSGGSNTNREGPSSSTPTQVQMQMSFFAVVSWPLGQAVLEHFNLPPRCFHITLGFSSNDIHDVPKDTSTLRRNDTAVFCDLDGTLCSFEERVKEITGQLPDDQPAGVMWPQLEAAVPPFFENLEWMPDGHLLWEAVRDSSHPTPTVVLTALPRGTWAVSQKEAWCAKHLGEDVKVHTCMSWQKRLQSRPGAVLVDDSIKYQADWEGRGGTFVLRTSVEETLGVLRDLHIVGGGPSPLPSSWPSSSSSGAGGAEQTGGNQRRPKRKTKKDTSHPAQSVWRPHPKVFLQPLPRPPPTIDRYHHHHHHHSNHHQPPLPNHHRSRHHHHCQPPSPPVIPSLLHFSSFLPSFSFTFLPSFPPSFRSVVSIVVPSFLCFVSHALSPF
jgi:hypothetical protein